ncbi:ammonium transporter [Pelagibacterium xiamenense]|uniref:ammonium transporter n=1 Tax=Pelagibacterium xiamenense TaxID=2901140 RepID=UPI001E5234CC|nr:ammonium transporter [Pelagibacterium xiamenense]MCD7058924.1 ammonium transporter [Pelagibacterium xiamenense]
MVGFKTLAAALAAGLCFGAAPAYAQDAAAQLADLSLRLDMVWLLVAAGLVLLMQAGFMLLEAGMVRSKNSVNVAQKNLLDLVSAVFVFAIFGFMLSFGTSKGPVGWDADFLFLRNLTPWEYAFFAFQVMFCGTAATIVSGAVAERLRLHSYVVCSLVVAGLVYPVFVHWAWGAALLENAGAFLANLGFVDFAGSTVVHATGGWVALAACWVLGPRAGKYGPDGKPVRLSGHSAVLTTAGTMLLFVGWIGFNGGSTAAAVPAIGPIIANTILAAGAGGFIGYVLGLALDDIALPEKPICGLLGGLVAVTAGCHVLDGTGALIVGLIGGIAAIWGNWLLEHKLRIDDAVGAIGVHGFSGVAGTLALVFLAMPDTLPHTNVLTQFGVQLFGVVLNFVWSFGLGFACFKLMEHFWSIRPTRAEEQRGLNEIEHNTRIGVGHVETALGALITGKAGLDLRLPVEHGDDAEALTHLFNRFMSRVEAAEKARGDQREIARAREEAERLSSMADAAFEGICVTVDGRIQDGNKALENLLGRGLETLRGLPFNDIVSPGGVGIVERALAADDGHPFEVAVVAIDGRDIPVEIRTKRVVYHGRMTRVFAISDLRERKIAEDRIRFLAQHDPLTGLPNRAVFNDQLETAIDRVVNRSTMGALLLVDLDRFKDVNDIHGHPAGDAVIRETAKRLTQTVGQDGIVARLGGDEFAVLVSDIHFENQASDLAHSIIEALCQPIVVDEKVRVRVGASVGVVVIPRDGNEGDLVFARADMALYVAKAGGRSTYSVFEPGMDAQLQVRRMLEADLEQAIDRNELELYFQPRIDLKQRRISGYEALLRWNHPKRGQISPAEFVPVAEASGQIVALGEWVLKQACIIARDRLGTDTVSINVSPVQFRDRTFVEKVLGIIEEVGIAPQRVELELTESVLVEDEGRAISIFKRLKAVGIKIALDDFGTGYSSLSYLQSFPFDCIKVDRSFVQNLSDDKNALAIAKAVIELGKSLDLRIVAEGVERQSELTLLSESGCDEVQGFLTGRPMPVDALPSPLPDAVAWLESGSVSERPDMHRALQVLEARGSFAALAPVAADKAG